MSGIYIHIPFCSRKCYYCDFYSVTDLLLADSFVNALCKEIELTAKTSNSQFQIETVFIGGGTPSALTTVQLRKIIKTLNKYFDLSKVIEFTIESNPGTLSPDKLKAYLDFGINRLSIGVQSLDDEELKFLQRVHSSKQAIENIESAKKIGFKNINADIIFSLPKQKWTTLEHTIDQLISRGIEHISAYSLIYEEGTPLFDALIKGEVEKNEDDSEADIYIEMINKFAGSGHKQYEISNFALKGYECLHNLNYWRRKEYYGFGPSAHSFINDVRYYNHSNLDTYTSLLNQSILPIAESEILDLDAEINEIFYLGLRAEGLDLKLLNEEFKIDLLDEKRTLVNKLISDKLAYINNNKLILTPSGYAICDYLSIALSDNY